MIRCAWVLLAVGLATLLVGCPKRSPVSGTGTDAGTFGGTPTNAASPQYYLNHAQPKLKTMKIWVGAQELEAELAVNVTEIATGMMFRTNMTDAEAMLFLFALPDRRSFYMRNCVLPLSAAYIDVNGVVDEIVDLHPGVEQGVPSRSDRIKYVLEVPQGWFKRFNVPVGTAVTTPTGPLKQFSGILQ